jgi:hypothetical protein
MSEVTILCAVEIAWPQAKKTIFGLTLLRQQVRSGELWARSVSLPVGPFRFKFRAA